MKNLLIACHDCDNMFKKTQGQPHTIAVCPNCGATLYKNQHIHLEWLTAMTIAALITWLITITTPIIALRLKAFQTQASFSRMLDLLNANTQTSLIVLTVLLVVFILPLLELVALLYLLFSLRKNIIPTHAYPCLKFIQHIRPWTMIPVFMLSIVVTSIKINHLAHLSFAPAFLAFACLTLFSTILVVFHPRDLWYFITSIQDQHA